MRYSGVTVLGFLLAIATLTHASDVTSPAPARVVFIDARTGSAYELPGAAVLNARLTPMLSQADSPDGLERLVDVVLSHARDHGRPVLEVEASVTSPDYGESAPVVQVRLWPGRIQSLSLQGGSPWQREVVAADWARRSGEELDLHAIEAWLDWTHRNPFHQVTLSFEPGSEPATADGLLSLHSESVARGFMTWRDDGVEPLGPQRFSTGIEIGDPGGLPLWASAEFVGGEDWPDYRSIRGQLRAFLPWHHEWRLAGSWTTAELDGFLPGLPITSSLRSIELNTRYVVPLGKWSGWRTDGGLGFDFRRTESGVSLDGDEARGEADTVQAVGEVAVRKVTMTTESAAVVSGFWSPGGVTAHNETSDAALLRPGAEADYYGVRAEAISRWEWPGRWAVVARGAAQWTSDPPLPTVQLAITGAQAVRGYDEAVVLADVGAWGGLELHAPGWTPPSPLNLPRLVPIVFADAGWARNEAEAVDHTIASAGLGLRVRRGGSFSFAFDYGWRLTDPGGRAHFALVLTF